MIIWVQNDMGILFVDLFTHALINELHMHVFLVHMYHLYLALGVVINPLPQGHYS